MLPFSSNSKKAQKQINYQNKLLIAHWKANPSSSYSSAACVDTTVGVHDTHADCCVRITPKDSDYLRLKRIAEAKRKLEQDRQAFVDKYNALKETYQYKYERAKFDKRYQRVKSEC